MSLIIAAKDAAGVVHLLADTQQTKGVIKNNYLSDKNYKIIKPIGLPNLLIGKVGELRDKTLLTAQDFKLNELTKITFKDVVRTIVPRMIEIFNEGGMKIEIIKEELDSAFLIAQHDKLFHIGDELSVTEIDDFIVLGQNHGELAAYGVMNVNEHLPAKERIIQAIKVAAKTANGVSAPYVYINTRDLEYVIIQEGE